MKKEELYDFIKIMPKPYKISSVPITKDYALEMLRILQQLIPKGIYCYEGKYRCPFWDWKDKKNDIGYCHYLRKSDDDLKGGLLWDACKECGINDNLE